MAATSSASNGSPALLSPKATSNPHGIDVAATPEAAIKNSYHPFALPLLDRRRFNTLRVLGHGAYAWVEEVRDNDEGAILAMKVVPALPDRRERVKAQVNKEVDILRKISGHCHIVQFRHAFADTCGFCVLVAPVADCDLSTFYGRCAADDFPEDMLQLVRMWFSCLAHGLAYIHSHRIRHKDIKPQNILVKDGKVLFADFGLSKDFAELEGLNSTTEGYTPKTPMYAAPEAIHQRQRRYSADVFSLGCVYAELASVLARKSVASFFDFRMKRDPDTEIITHAFHSTLHLVRDWLSHCNLRIRYTIDRMLLEDPLDRPRATDLQASIVETIPELTACSHLPLARNSFMHANDKRSRSATLLCSSGHNDRKISERLRSHQGAMEFQPAATPSFSRRLPSERWKVSSSSNALGLYQHANLSEESLQILNQMQRALDAQDEKISETTTCATTTEDALPESTLKNGNAPQLKRCTVLATKWTTEHIPSSPGFGSLQNDLTLRRNVGKSVDYYEMKQTDSRDNPRNTSALSTGLRSPDSAPNYILVLLGDGGVGKTALVTSFLFGQVFEEYDPTIEDSYRKNVYINEKPHLLQIIDTAGQDVHSALREQRIAEAHGFLVVYSIASRVSFERVIKFTNQICQRKGTAFPSRRCTLVGTKSDLAGDREVSTEEGSKRASKLGYTFTETSAVLNLGIRETFLGAASSILDQG